MEDSKCTMFRKFNVTNNKTYSYHVFLISCTEKGKLHCGILPSNLSSQRNHEKTSEKYTLGDFNKISKQYTSQILRSQKQGFHSQTNPW